MNVSNESFLERSNTDELYSCKKYRSWIFVISTLKNSNHHASTIYI